MKNTTGNHRYNRYVNNSAAKFSMDISKVKSKLKM